MPQISIKRIYEPASPSDGVRVLVDRIWPRGISKEDASLDHWAKTLAPSTQLRKWFNHDPAKWALFQQRYRKELEDRVADLDDLAKSCGDRTVTLLYGAKDTEHNQAVVLKSVLEEMRARKAPA